jgi:benzoyl-CoA 2,3-dioxygenase component B
MQIPDQRIRDSLLHLIVYQGDTEFASSEQQRRLLKNPPSNYDLQCAVRVMREEMRHGWQMSYLLVKHFGRSGKLEAEKLLERHAYEGTRLLGAFNQDVHDWLDFYCYTALVDRDGKYQLTMLSRSAFQPLAASMGPMLQEEAFHLLSGFTGLSRIIRANRVPVPMIQRHINKWYSAALDLFGVDHSNSAHWNYVWGLKGRFDEGTAGALDNPDELNELARRQYRQEVDEILQALNRLLRDDQAALAAPDHRFNRALGDFAGKPYSTTGVLLSPAEYATHAAKSLPSSEDKEFLAQLAKEPGWILPVGS